MIQTNTPVLHKFWQQHWRGIQDKHCRAIQDTLNIKEKLYPGFHDFSQFSCPGFHEKQQNSMPVHCNERILYTTR